MLILISCPCLARIFLINGRDSEHHKLSSRLTIASHHHRLVHPLEIAYLSETNNHCKNFADTFFKTSRTVWVTWWVEESWCLRLHKVRCCYDLHSLKWKPWVIQLKPGSGAAAAVAAGGGSFCSQTYLITCMQLKQQHQDAAGWGGKQWTWIWGDGRTHQQYEPSLRTSCMHISSEIFSLSHTSCIHLIYWILTGAS